MIDAGPIVIQVAAIVIAAGVLWMARGVADVKNEVAVLSVLMKGVCKDLEAIQLNYVSKHDHEDGMAAMRKAHEEMSAHFYQMREEHLRCRPCNEARDTRV